MILVIIRLLFFAVAQPDFLVAKRVGRFDENFDFVAGNRAAARAHRVWIQRTLGRLCGERRR